MTNVFEAARTGDLVGLRAALAAGADAAATDAQGWAPLHLAAAGAQTDPAAATAVLAELLDAGALVEQPGGDGRTALYLAAEFSPTTQPVELLLARGANPDITDGHGNHITVNAWTPEVTALLTAAAGRGPGALAAGSTPESSPPERKLSLREWRAAKQRINDVFDQLTSAGFVALAGAGSTQSDGFDDCHEAASTRGDGLVGFCYYTRQDAKHARETGQLSLAFWGAPDGSTPRMEHAGELVVRAFRAAGFGVDWDGTATLRPAIDLTS
ncbi:DUF6891 domain-containing protein [Streptomyces sp. NPDC058001]|uniref:DUF6891 domain-containing protein n=1 Tax=Streptomyces sp. NPDC058001 TaxID=3346300 RepID=UPI0036EFC608